MLTFDEFASKLRWTGEPLDRYVVGYEDRFEKKPVEIPLAELLASEIPRHRARYVKRGWEIVWDRRPSTP